MKEFSKFENANAILNGMDDCSEEFVQHFVSYHQKPIDNEYMYDWLIRSIMDTVKTNHSVLYVACGTAGYRRVFNNIKRFVGVDFSNKMITAAKAIDSKPEISFDFQCSTFEKFQTDELFDVIYLGPYGNNVPFTYECLEKAKSMLKEDGMIFCTCPDPDFKGNISKYKHFFKNLIFKKNFDWHPVRKLEKMLKKTNLETHIKLRMKTCLGHCFLYVVKTS